jgi:hypothetical protein
MMTNTELLEWSGPEELIHGVDRQRRFLLRLHIQRMPCPNCGHEQNFFEAQGIENIDDFDYTKSERNDHFECINCRRELRHNVPFISMGGPGWYWGLVPIKIGDPPQTYGSDQDEAGGLT